MLSVVILKVTTKSNAEGHYAECRSGECPLVECHFAESRNKCLYAMCRFVECPFLVLILFLKQS
jgi:hypothetical protein